MRRFAAETDVPAERSRAEIEKTLERYGAGQFVYGWDAEKTMVGFTSSGRQIRFIVPMPQADEHRLIVLWIIEVKTGEKGLVKRYWQRLTEPF